MGNGGGEGQRSIINVEQDIIFRLSEINKFCSQGIEQISNEGKSDLTTSNKLGETLESIFDQIEAIREYLYELDDLVP